MTSPGLKINKRGYTMVEWMLRCCSKCQAIEHTVSTQYWQDCVDRGNITSAPHIDMHAQFSIEIEANRRCLGTADL